MGISVIPSLLEENLSIPPTYAGPEKLTVSDIAKTGRYYRHPDSALISYPVVVEKPLGSIKKPVNIAIIGGGAAGIAALYELSNLPDSSDNIHVTIYESDPENFVHHLREARSLTTRGLTAGRVYAAKSSDKPGGTDHAVYEIGAMRFPEIAGLMWHYAKILYPDQMVSVFPNPGTVPTELVHGNQVDRFGRGKWLNPNSPAKKVVDVIRKGFFGQPEGPNTSFFQIDGKDPAKISAILKSEDTSESTLTDFYKKWKDWAKIHDERTLQSGIREIIQKSITQLPDVDGLLDETEKVNHFVELFGTVGFGTGGFKTMFNMALTEMMRLLLWNYSNEYVLPTQANAHFIKGLYWKAHGNNPNVKVKLARVSDVAHLDENSKGEALVVSYDISPKDGTENPKPQVGVYNYVILTSTPRQTSAMISKLGFDNCCCKVTLGDYDRPLKPEDYEGKVRPALVLSDKFETANSKVYTAVNNVHMVSSAKIFATVKKSDFDSYAPDFLDQGKIKAIASDCGLGSSYVVPSTVIGRNKDKINDYYSFLISYTWEDGTKRLQHHLGKYPLNLDTTDVMLKEVINRTVRNVKDPVKKTVGPWWFGTALSNTKLEDPLSFDWTTVNTSGGFKVDMTGDYYNSHLLFRYHTHALQQKLKNKFFLANDCYSHLGGWIEGALMSAVNAVCGLIVAANDGDINALSPEAQKVVQSFDSVVKNNK